MAHLHELKNVHTEEQCAGEHCSIHNPSEHPLKDAPLWFRVRGRLLLTERICKCGISHPDFDWLDFLRNQGMSEEDVEVEAIHGCCGHCEM